MVAIWAKRYETPMAFRNKVSAPAYPRQSVTCLIPQRGGTIDHHAWREELWAKVYTAAPRRLRQSVERYSGVKRA